MMLLTLRGTPVLYYGDEIGLPNVDVDQDHLRDPVGIRYYPAYPGRDPGRTPMQWSSEPGAGFTTGKAEPWLPFGDTAACNVETQRKDPNSVLHLCRDLIALRRRTHDLESGDTTPLPAAEQVWAWRRGDGTVVAVNLGDTPAAVDGIRGRILVATRRDRDGESANGALALAPWEGAVIAA